MRHLTTIILLIIINVDLLGQVIINEIMQSNVYEVYQHNDGKFPASWIELYNPTDEPVRIREFSIGETPDFSQSKKFEMLWYVLPMCYLTIQCDKQIGHKNAELDLDPDGGAIYLFNEEGEIVDSLTYPEMQAPNVSYGMDEETGEFGMMLRPTPEGPNTKIAKELPKKVHFSADGGVWENAEPFYVELTASNVPNYYAESLPVDSSLCIRYTLNGSEPNDSSSVYYEPIYIDSTKIIKAKVFNSACPLIPAQTQSYILLDRNVTLPTVSIVTEDSFLFGKERGLLVWDTIYDRRIPINIEIRYGDSISINQLVQTRVHGASSASLTPQRALAVYAKKRLGQKRFKGVLWEEKPNVNKNKSFILRTGGGNFDGLQITDAWAQKCMGLYSEVDYQAHTPAIAFINGKYYGRVNIRERSNSDFVYANYNEEDVEVCKIWNDDITFSSGDGSFFNELDLFCEEEHTLEEWSNVFDINNMIDSYITYFFFSAVDVQNNGLMWRPASSSGKWHFIIKDLDKTCNIFSEDGYFEWFSRQRISKYLFDALKNKEFQELFLNRFVAFHGDFLNHDKCMETLYKMYDEVREETEEYHNPRWEFNTNNDSIISSISDFLKIKTEKAHSYLSDYFKIGKPVIVNVEGCEHFTYDDVPMHFGSFHGKDFEGRTISLKVSEESATPNLIWDIRIYSNSDSTKYCLTGENISIEIPYGTEQIDVNIMKRDLTDSHNISESIYLPFSDNSDTEATIYNPLGQKVSQKNTGTPKIYLKKDNTAVKKFIVK